MAVAFADMSGGGSTYRQQLDVLTKHFGMFDYGQDWGICNADGDRLREFLSYFEQHHDDTWPSYIVEDYVDLVLESASQVLRQGPDASMDLIDSFVRIVAPIVPDRLDYWTSNDWPVSPHLLGLGQSS